MAGIFFLIVFVCTMIAVVFLHWFWAPAFALAGVLFGLLGIGTVLAPVMPPYNPYYDDDD